MSNFLHKLNIVAASLLIGSSAAFAIPAKPGVLRYPLPDGTTIDVTLHGDEHGAYYMSTDGYVLLPGNDSRLYYALGTASEIAPSNVAARNVAERTPADKAFLSVVDREATLKAAVKDVESKRMQVKRRTQTSDKIGTITDYPTTGSPKAMVLLVQFDDIKFSGTAPQGAFNDLINKNGYDYNGATGSARDYFVENSCGAYTPDFKVFGPVTVPHSESYYGAAQGMNYDTRAWDMVVDACNVLHEEQPELDWSEFDCDGDGFVDNIFVFYAGYGQNEGAPAWTIWPHSAKIYDFYNIELKFNGVMVNNYACTNELKGTNGSTVTGIGTFCHEFSHVLGLPDLYSTNYSGSFTPGAYDLMDMGSYNNESNTPPFMSAFERYSLGWLNPRELTGPESVELPSIVNNVGYIINTERPQEYYFLENRQQSAWDTYIPGHGMLIWHIEYDYDIWMANTANNNPTHMRIDIVEADNIGDTATQAGDPFPGSSNVTSFTSTTVPAMSTWYGQKLNMPLTTIREVDGVIYFRVQGGGDRIEAVEALPASNVTPLSFTANYTTTPGIVTYEVDVCRDRAVVPFVTLKGTNSGSVEVTDLTPSTDYSYVVRAVEADRKSEDSNRITVTTDEPYFSMTTPAAPDAKSVGHDSFIAYWAAHPRAAGYILDVYEKNVTAPKNVTADFTKEGTRFVPEGWYTNCTQTAGLAGFFGQSRPALQMSNNGDQVQTPVFDEDINAVSFWFRGNNNVEGNTICVEVLNAAGNWVAVKSFDATNEAAGQTLGVGGEFATRMPLGARSARVIYYKADGAAGAAYIDDLSIDYAGSYTPVYVEDFHGVDVGNVLETAVTGLLPQHQYFFTITAYDAAGEKSMVTEEGYALTAEQAGVSSATAAGFTVLAAQGTITVTGAEGTVELFDVAGMLVGSAEGDASFTGLLPGVYVVHSGGSAVKALLK